MMIDPNDRPAVGEDDPVADWDDFEEMTDRVLALPPQPDDD